MKSRDKWRISFTGDCYLSLEVDLLEAGAWVRPFSGWATSASWPRSRRRPRRASCGTSLDLSRSTSPNTLAWITTHWLFLVTNLKRILQKVFVRCCGWTEVRGRVETCRECPTLVRRTSPCCSEACPEADLPSDLISESFRKKLAERPTCEAETGGWGLEAPEN